MKKVWDFLLLLVSGLLVFVAIIAVALWLTWEDEPPATADSLGESTEKVVAAHATAPSALVTVPASPATVPETPGATPAAVQHHESMAGAPASAPADSLTRHEETREASPEGMAQGASGPSVAPVSAAPSTVPTSAAQPSGHLEKPHHPPTSRRSG